jgi:phosphoglycerate dehydrogenase-like enzyme
MVTSSKILKIHIKNNRWKKGSFPNTPEGEKIFSISNKNLENQLIKFPELKDKIEFFIDWDEDNFTSSMKDSSILLTWDLPKDNLNQVASNLKWIHCIGAGVEHLYPFNWLPDHVVLTNNKGVHSKKAGEFGLMAILILHNHFQKIITNQFKRKYDSIYSTPIKGKNIIIVGTGSLGSSVANLIKPLGVNVIGVNRHGNPKKEFSKIISKDKIDDILPEADILYLALPETPETINFIDERRLNLLKKTCSIVNIGRESVLDYQTLFKMLSSKMLAGAILDVFTPEPIDPDSPIWNVPNLIVSPHVSADDGKSYIHHTLDLFFNNLNNLISKQPLQNQVDRELGY